MSGSSHSLLGLVGALTLVACGDIGLQPLPSGPVGAPHPGAQDTEGTWEQADDSATNGGTGGGSSSGGNTGGGNTNSSNTQSTDTSVDCTHDTFPILMHQATQDNSTPGQPLFMYQARDVDRAPFDELQILSYQAAPYHGPTTPGSYTLDGSNYADCALCVLMVTDCNNNYQCDQVFFVDQGTLDVEAFGAQGGNFKAVLRDAVFLEVTIDPSTYETTPVPGGESWCIDEIDIDVSTYVYN